MGVLVGIIVGAGFVGLTVGVVVGFLLGVGVFVFFTETPFTSAFVPFSTIGFFIFVFFWDFESINTNNPTRSTIAKKLPAVIPTFT